MKIFAFSPSASPLKPPSKGDTNISASKKQFCLSLFFWTNGIIHVLSIFNFI